MHMYFLIKNQKIFHSNYQLKIIDVSTSDSNLILNRRSEFVVFHTC